MFGTTSDDAVDGPTRPEGATIAVFDPCELMAREVPVPTSVGLKLIREAFGDVVPRRAAVVSGRVIELARAVDTVPVEALVEALVEARGVSRVCEAVKTACGEVCWSRNTATLLDQAVASNDPRAWEAACDDLDTGHFDVRAAAAATDSARATGLAMSLVNARTTVHLLWIVRVVVAVFPRLEGDSLRAAGGVLGADIPRLATRVGRLAAALRREQREAVMDAVGRAVAAADVPGPVLDSGLRAVSREARFETLRMFSATSLGTYVTPVTFEALVNRVCEASSMHRVAGTSVVAKCLAENPALGATCRPQLARLVGAVFGSDNPDVRGALAASVIARAAFDCPIVRGIATFTERACAELVASKKRKATDA